MDLMFGLSVVDQLDGGRRTRQLAEGWMHRSPRSGRWLRQRLAAALVALAARLAPAATDAATASRPVQVGRP